MFPSCINILCSKFMPFCSDSDFVFHYFFSVCNTYFTIKKFYISSSMASIFFIWNIFPVTGWSITPLWNSFKSITSSLFISAFWNISASVFAKSTFDLICITLIKRITEVREGLKKVDLSTIGCIGG